MTDIRKNNRLGGVIKRILAATIVVATLALFIYYLQNNPHLITVLAGLDLPTLLLLAIGYSLVVVVNAGILHYSLLFIKKKIPPVENLLVTGYSSIVNFFGPLQSGPGFRAVYLKKKYGVRIRNFFGVSLIFYGFFGLINALIIIIALAYKFNFSFVGFLLISLLAVIVLVAIVKAPSLDWLRTRVTNFSLVLKIKDRNFWMIGLGALLVALVTTGIYYMELLHVDAAVSPLQVVVYSAAANMALFVSLTPGAIGIRESFLLLAQQIHNISTDAIVGASIIDRAFYVAFLLLLFAVLVVVSNRKHLPLPRLKSRE